MSIPRPPAVPHEPAGTAGAGEAERLSADARARLAEQLAGLENLRGETERLAAQHSGPCGASISVAADALDEAVIRVHAILDSTRK